MVESADRQKQNDHGGRRRIKDRRFQVPVPPDKERRTNWKRRNGMDQRIKNNEPENN